MNKIIKKKKKAFTLIELIIVLAIMAIIAAIAIPNFTAVRNNSKVKADTASKETIKRTILMLVSDETIVTGIDKTATLTFDPTTKAITGFASGSTFVGSVAAAVTPTASATGESKVILEALHDVKAPQSVATFVINMASNGEITVP